MADTFEMTEGFKSEIEKAIKTYEENGIVTKQEVKSLISLGISRKIYKAFMDNGYNSGEVFLEEISLENHYDYSCVIYDINRYSPEEAKEYMLKYVLSDKYI